MAIRLEDGHPRSYRDFDQRLDLKKETLDELNPEEREALEGLLEVVGDEVDLSPVSGHEYIRPVASIDEFVTDEYLLGTIGKTLYPKIRQSLVELFSGNGYSEALITGALGIGKNVFATIAISYMVYRMSCLRNPQKTYRLEEGSEIAFVCLSINEALAKRAVFGGVKTKIMTSRYFMEQFPFKQTLTQLRFPNNIWVAASSSSIASALSLNTFGGILDEVNFMAESPPSVLKIRYGNRQRKDRVSHAETLYDMLVRRMKSRYSRGGKVPGTLILTSSASHQDAFLEKRIAAAADDPNIFVISYPIWTVKREVFSDNTFCVFVGNERLASRILGDDDLKRVIGLVKHDPDYADCRIIEVPIDFQRDFESNLEESLQDFAGVATVAISPFIQRREALYDAIDDTREHPMSVVSWNPAMPADIDWDSLVQRYVTQDRRGNEERFVGPVVNPEAPRHVHVDTSVSHDATGVCIGHIAGQIDVKRRDINGQVQIEQAPEIYIDFMCQVVPPPGEDIIMADVRTLLYGFIDRGYHFSMFTTDQFQSVEMRQYMQEQRGVYTELLSVDRNAEPYRELRSALYEGRITYYKYEPFLKELQRVVHDKVRGKVDHVVGGSKDCSDAVAAVVYSLTMQGYQQPIGMQLGISEFGGQKDDKDMWIRRTLPSSGSKPVKKLGPGKDEDDPGWILPLRG